MTNNLCAALDAIMAEHDLTGIGLTRYSAGSTDHRDDAWNVVTVSWGGIGTPEASNSSGHGDTFETALAEAIGLARAKRMRPIQPTGIDALALNAQVAA